MPSHPPFRSAILALALALALAGCESVRQWTPPLLHAYRPDVQQGNVVTKEMADQLTVGLTRDQVRFLLGTPALVSIFRQDRWDYVYLLRRGADSEVQSRRLTVHFKDDRLERFESDPMPPEALADNLILGRKPKAEPQPPPKEVEPQFKREIEPTRPAPVPPI